MFPSIFGQKGGKFSNSSKLYQYECNNDGIFLCVFDENLTQNLSKAQKCT